MSRRTRFAKDLDRVWCWSLSLRWMQSKFSKRQSSVVRISLWKLHFRERRKYSTKDCWTLLEGKCKKFLTNMEASLSRSPNFHCSSICHPTSTLYEFGFYIVSNWRTENTKTFMALIGLSMVELWSQKTIHTSLFKIHQCHWSSWWTPWVQLASYTYCTTMQKFYIYFLENLTAVKMDCTVSQRMSQDRDNWRFPNDRVSLIMLIRASSKLTLKYAQDIHCVEW